MEETIYNTKRVTVPEIEEILCKEFKVLDHGFVRLIDYMGNDSAIVQAARVSYGKGTKSVREDEALIRYLMRHEHMSPFEMVEMKWHCKMPIFVARQWIRHRTANVNEYSMRYSEAENDLYVPKPDEVHFQSVTNRQGSEEREVPSEIAKEVIDIININNEETFQKYYKILEKDIAREQARMVLPLNLYTQWYWKNDLHNTLHFLKLRLDKHAQYEIREYAKVMADIVKKLVPITWKAFEDYKLNSITLSQLEKDILVDISLAESNEDKRKFIEENLPKYLERIENKFERNEVFEKFKKLFGV